MQTARDIETSSGGWCGAGVGDVQVDVFLCWEKREGGVLQREVLRLRTVPDGGGGRMEVGI